MRRRRKHLEVSTFPFLAVLLCTMGSLILVLLVMDRKAKLAARQKAEGIVARAAEDSRRAVEERRASVQRRNEEAKALRERQRQGLHAQLVSDEQDLQNQLRLVSLRLAEALTAFRLAQERLEGLRKQVEEERVHILENEQAAKRERDAAAASAVEETAAAKAAAAAALADVAKLESKLAELKAARGREKQTYSVVPYRGKRGDDRRPVYVECSARGVIFHPERKELSPPLQNEDVRAGVARHAAALHPGAAAEERPPYCLLLVRPDGIEPYWELQAVLRSLQIDFGYEFIDADWLLDFPEDEQTPSKTWANGSDSGPGLGPVLTPPGTGVRGVSPVRPTMGSGPPGDFPGAGAVTGGRPVEGTGQNGSGEIASNRTAFEGLFPGRTGSGGAATSGNMDGSIGPRGVGAAASQVFTAGPVLQGNGVIGTSGSPGAGNAGPVAPGTPTGAAPSPGGEFASARTKPDDGARAPTPGISGPGARGPGTKNATGQPVIGTPTAQTSGGNAEGQQPVAPDSQPSGTSANKAAGPRREGDAAQGTASPGGDPTQSSGPPGASGSSAPARLPLPTDRFRPAKSTDEKEPPARRLARLNDRDWIIYIECREESAILYPSLTEFPLTALSGPPETNALLAAVRRMIERRQSGVRTGDVPYRPEVRFLIRPNCLRTFHATYPALDTLVVPKTRQNLAADDDVRNVMQ